MGVSNCDVAEADGVSAVFVGSWAKADGGKIVGFLGLNIEN